MRNVDPSLVALLDSVRKAYESIPERFRKEDQIQILTRVIARLVPGLKPVEDVRASHSWLIIESNRQHIIDLLPKEIYPGPVIVRLETGRQTKLGHGYCDGPDTTKWSDSKNAQAVAEIVEATEAARRFLGTP